MAVGSAQRLMTPLGINWRFAEWVRGPDRKRFVSAFWVGLGEADCLIFCAFPGAVPGTRSPPLRAVVAAGALRLLALAPPRPPLRLARLTAHMNSGAAKTDNAIGNRFGIQAAGRCTNGPGGEAKRPTAYRAGSKACAVPMNRGNC